MSNGVRVLVTGGYGFVGSHLVDALVTAGYRVTVIDSLDPQVHPSRAVPAYAHPIEEVPAEVFDVRNREALRAFLVKHRPQAVVHLAAAVGVGQAEHEIERYVDTNVRGTAILLEEILRANDTAESGDEGIRRLIVAGSMSAYGEGMWACPTHGVIRAGRKAAQLADGIWDPICPMHYGPGCENAHALTPQQIFEWSSLNPSGIYAATKRDQEDLSLLVAKSSGLSVAVPRFFNVIGERQALSNPYTGVAAIFASRCLAGLAPRVYEDGHQLRDFIHVSDVVSALLALLIDPNMILAERGWARPDLQGSFNVCTGEGTSVLQLAQLACETIEPSLSPEVTGQYRVGDIRSCIGSPEKLYKVTGWYARVAARQALTDLFKGLQESARTELTRAEINSVSLELAHQELVNRGLVFSPAPVVDEDEGTTRWAATNR